MFKIVIPLLTQNALAFVGHSLKIWLPFIPLNDKEPTPSRSDENITFQEFSFLILFSWHGGVKSV